MVPSAKTCHHDWFVRPHILSFYMINGERMLLLGQSIDQISRIILQRTLKKLEAKFQVMLKDLLSRLDIEIGLH